MSSINVTAPCSSANLGSGFDIFGLALDIFHDILRAEITEEKIEIDFVGLGSEDIPKDPEKNTVGLVAKELLKDRKIGVKIKIHKNIPLKMGLGSSGASAAACVVALNELLKLDLSSNEMIRIAAMGEIASAGVEHADNVAASLLGGFVMVHSFGESLFHVRFDPPSNLEVALALPLIDTPENKTEVARKMLPKSVSLKKAFINTANAALLMAGFHLNDVGMVGRGMTDLIVEPSRKILIPGFDKVKMKALSAGAVGAAISGAGPAVIAIVDGLKASTNHIAEVMKDAFESEGVACKSFCGKPSVEGTRNI